ncbi:MAG: hypothetical protein OXR66_07045 [Candidatus Woesearchaeota archaeon]|nr:hypothetical protein [Candidatus Woesearchaeota archaeon]
MENWMIASIAGFVVVVALFGFTQGMPTANVVYDPCDFCEGQAVCAVKDNVARTYENACAANCAGARVLSDGDCLEQ